MDSLIAIGSGAAAIYGIYAIYKIGIGMGHVQKALAAIPGVAEVTVSEDIPKKRNMKIPKT